MPMNSIPLLRVLLQRVEAERDTALGVLRQVEAQAQQALAQARQLQDYRGECDQRWLTRFQTSGTTELLHCHRGFSQRLDQAITMQDNSASQLGQRTQRARETLMAREQRVAAVRKLIERREAEHQLLANRRDQRNTDDAAQRAHSAAKSRDVSAY